MKWLTPFILIIAIFFNLTACGTSLEKPTGLEEAESENYEDGKNVDDNSEGEIDQFEKKSENENSDDLEVVTTKESSEKEKSTINKEKDSTSHKDNNGDQNKQSSKHSTEKEKEKSSSKIKLKKHVKKSTGKTEDKAKTKQSSKTSKKLNKGKSSSKPKQESKPKNTIDLSIVISSSEVPLSQTEHEIKDGDTVLDALIAVTMDHGVHLDYSGSGGTAYVKGLGNVYEFDRGQGSGWMYRINRVFPDRGVGVVPLKDGDRVEFLYTTDLGKDIGADLKPFRR